MRSLSTCTLSILALTALAPTSATAGWSIGVGIGGPVYYRPYPYYYHPYPYYYRPYGAVYIAPPPVVVEPAPVVQAVPVAPQPVYAAPAPPSTPVVAKSQPVENTAGEANFYLQKLADADERVRADSVMHLGRLRASQAVDPLAATLAGDRSPAVREAAARALGLIGSPNAMPALQRAAQADNDRDVRHSAQFAVEVIQTRN
jgi:hypothetical protein